MASLIGEYDCKVDAKGRFMFPVDLRKQMDALLAVVKCEVISFTCNDSLDSYVLR